jgi:hypothetical protein
MKRTLAKIDGRCIYRRPLKETYKNGVPKLSKARYVQYMGDYIPLSKYKRLEASKNQKGGNNKTHAKKSRAHKNKKRREKRRQKKQAQKRSLDKVSWKKAVSFGPKQAKSTFIMPDVYIPEFEKRPPIFPLLPPEKRKTMKAWDCRSDPETTDEECDLIENINKSRYSRLLESSVLPPPKTPSSKSKTKPKSKSSWRKRSVIIPPPLPLKGAPGPKVPKRKLSPAKLASRRRGKSTIKIKTRKLPSKKYTSSEVQKEMDKYMRDLRFESMYDPDPVLVADLEKY